MKKKKTKTNKPVKKSRTQAKTAAKVKKIVSTTKKQTQKVIDQALVKIPPQLRAQLDKMNDKIQETDWSVPDLKLLGLKILEKAQEVSSSLKLQQSKNKPKRKSK